MYDKLIDSRIDLLKKESSVLQHHEIYELNHVDLNLDTLDRDLEQRMHTQADLFATTRSHRNNKRQKVDHSKPILYLKFNCRLGKPKLIRLKALLDSGASGCLIARQHTTKLRVKPEPRNVWSTPAGTMKTHGTCKARFILNELNPNKTIEWKLNVAPT